MTNYYRFTLPDGRSVLRSMEEVSEAIAIAEQHEKGNLDCVGIDDDGSVYFNGEPLMITKKIKL